MAGYGKVDGRQVVIMANDFTVLAATSSRIAGRKEAELKMQASRRGHPVICFGEAGGARMPDIMGAAGLCSYGGGGFGTYLRIMSRVRQTPMITAIMGECYGMICRHTNVRFTWSSGNPSPLWEPANCCGGF